MSRCIYHNNDKFRSLVVCHTYSYSAGVTYVSLAITISWFGFQQRQTTDLPRDDPSLTPSDHTQQKTRYDKPEDIIQTWVPPIRETFKVQGMFFPRHWFAMLHLLLQLSVLSCSLPGLNNGNVALQHSEGDPIYCRGTTFDELLPRYVMTSKHITNMYRAPMCTYSRNGIIWWLAIATDLPIKNLFTRLYKQSLKDRTQRIEISRRGGPGTLESDGAQDGRAGTHVKWTSITQFTDFLLAPSSGNHKTHGNAPTTRRYSKHIVFSHKVHLP